MSSSDKILVAQFLKTRKEKDFIPVYRKYADTLYRLALFLSKNDREIAADIIQETWVTVVEKLPEFAWRSSLRTWITGILINQFRMSLRKNKTYAELNATMKITEPVSTGITAIDLKHAILQLPLGYREVMVMHDLEGFKHKEIATMLNISEGTSKSQLFQARRHMRDLLHGYEKQRTNS